MSADQVHLAGAIVAAFAAVVCVWQLSVTKVIHWLWLLLLLAGIVAWAVTR